MTDGRRPDGEALRRRLYRPGATEADVAAYDAAAAAEAPAEVVAPEPARPAEVPARAGTAGVPVDAPDPAPAPKRSKRLLLGLALAVPALLVVALVVRPGAPSPAPSPTATPAASPSLQPDGAAVSSAERAGFISRLVAGEQAGLSTYLDRHAQDLPAALAQATRSDTLEFAGDGTGAVELDPPSIGDDGGRVTVLLVLSADGEASWALTRPRTDDPAQSTSAGSASGGQTAGAMTAATVSYAPGQRPTRLRVAAPPGVRWGVAAVFSN